MKTNYKVILFVLLALFVSNALANNPYAKGRLMVKFRETALKSNRFQFQSSKGIAVTGLASIDKLNAQYKASGIKNVHPRLKNQLLARQLETERWYMLTFPDSEDMVALAKLYKNNPNIEDATPDWRVYPVTPPNDPHYGAQWGHDNTGQFPGFNSATGQHNGPLVGTVGFDGRIYAAWNFLGNYGSSGITIGIIDSGVDLDHPDLVGNLVTGYDFGSNDSNPDDNSAQPGHGTACAGVTAARTNNGIGVAGVAGGCKIMPLKVADNNGDMYFSAIQSALYYAADHDVHIVSMSLGNSEITSDPLTDAALQYAFNSGVTLLAATGNENTDHIGYPACNQYVISVGAASPCSERKSGTSCDGESWWGSNYGLSAQDAGGAVDIIAPCIIPTTDIAGAGGYNSGDYNLYFNGTSSATPFAAGVCALILSQHPAWTPAQVRQQLVMTATDVVNTESVTGWDRYSGYGMVNAYAALTTPPPANNPPVFTATGPFTVTAFASEGTVAGNINANNGDGGANDAGITYSITVNVDPDGDGVPAFAIHTTTGILTVADAGDLNDVLNPSLAITVQADDGIHQTPANIIIYLSTPPAGTIRYVDCNVSGGANNGTNWQNAYSSLQTALAASASGDAIFVKYGTYKPTTGTDKEISFNIPSGVAVYGHFAGNETAAWQRVLDNPDYETILSGDIGVTDNNTDNSYHVVTFRGVSSTTRLDGFTIKKGYAFYVNPDGSFNKDDERNCAGGILNAAGYPDIRNCLITENVGGVYGGGMFAVSYTTPTITNCRFISNSVGGVMPGWGGRGAGLGASGSNVIVRNSIFSGNSGNAGAAIDNTNSCSNRGRGEFINCIIENSNGGSEAAIVNWGADPIITDCIIRNNSATVGGGMINRSSYPIITDCLFENNSSLYYYDDVGGGGGMRNEACSPTITGCTFLNNHGTFGAAIINKNGSSPNISRSKFICNSDGSAIYNSNNSNPVITSCLISGNSFTAPSWFSVTLGGGISNIGSSPTIVNCTFSGNRTTRNGGGMYNENANPIIKNTIIYDNGATIAGNEVYNSTSSPVFSYSTVKGCGSSGSWNSAIGSDGGHNIDANPVFSSPIMPSAAPTTAGDFHVYQHSPVIDAGNNAAISELLDLDGETRIKNGTVDIGAYESGSGQVWFVKAVATGANTGVSWANAFTDLQDALDIVTAGDEIYIAGGTYKPDGGMGSRDITFEIPAGVKVYGHFIGTEVSYFDRTLADPAHETILSGNIGSAGYADNSYHVVSFLNAGDGTLLDGVTISQGNADGSGNAGQGGGVFIGGCSPILRNNIITGNVAVYGGGIAATGACSPVLINCVLMGNSATSGGAMSSIASSAPQLINCSMSGNKAGTNGGALYNLDASPVIRNSILWGNSPTGGVIFNAGTANPSWSYCDVQASGGSTAWNSAYGQDGGQNTDIDPLFVAGPDYSTAPSTTGYLVCYKASPVVNAGSNSFVTSDTWFDIAGLTRIQNGTVDMGAYEGNNLNVVLYVKGDATGANNGTNWANAFTNLQSALIRVSGGDKIYVARGTYLPSTTTDRSVSFNIRSGVEVYGHFSGSESGPDQRTMSNADNKTVLSGDIGTPGNNGDNTYHVVVFSWASASTILDGVTISGGNASSEPNDYGGGIRVGDASPLIRNCVISGNNAVYGGGMAVSYSSRPTLVNCIFSGNQGTVGYAIFSGRNSTEDRSAFTLINSVVYGNSRNLYYYNDAAITSMSSDYWGFHPQIKNTIIWGNSDLAFNGYWQGNAEFYNCNIQGSGGSGVWSMTYGMDKGGNIDADPQFVDQSIGNFRLQDLSPCINTGNNSYVPAFAPSDLDGAERVQGIVDMGAYEKNLLIYLSTARINAITKISAISGGDVGGTEAGSVTVKGVCWNTTGSPTISDNKTENGAGGGSFVSNMTGLSESTLYYVRAYATDGVNTYYGDEILFTSEMDPPGYALNFDGTNDYVSLQDETAFDVSTSLTVEVWLKVGSFDKSWQTIIAKGDNSWRIARYPDTDRLNFACSGLSTGSVTGNIGVNDGKWHHIAGVYNGSTLALYVDGVLDNSVGTSGTISNSNYPVYIGDNSQATGRFFNGWMDEIRIWNVARTPEEISSNRNNIIDPATINLVAYYRFDELAGNTLRDLTPNGHDGVLKNMTNANWVPSGAMSSTYTIAYNGNDATSGTVPEAQTKNHDVTLILASNTGNLHKTGFTFTCWNTQADGNGIDYAEGGDYTANASVTLYAKWTVVCTNPVAGGEIAANQANCGSFTPAELTSVSGPTGMSGTLEYKWQKSTTGSTLGFDDIEGTNSDTYSPGTVTQTTWYKRIARVTCKTDWTGAAASNVVEMTVEQTPVSGTLAKTPNVTDVCEGENVSAVFTAGSGGNGTDELESNTQTGGLSWSGWTAYTSGTAISTTGKTAVAIRTRRLANYCTAADFLMVSWSVEQTPVSGILAKNPDVTNVGQGTGVAASLTPGTGGNGNDVLEFRTMTGATWSDWTSYTSGQVIPTAGLAAVGIRTWREAGQCEDASVVSVAWDVDQTTMGGVVTGGTLVCYGSHTTLLTLSGHTGSVVKWQYSTNGSDWTDIANTGTTYTATNLTVNTWFRAVVQSGVCPPENSAATQITMFTDYHISGYAKYYNNPKTPLDGLKITLKKGGVQQGMPVTTGSNGWFDFGGLTNGTYDIEVTSAHSSGQWQTWNGCNNTDYLLVSRHASGVAPLVMEPPVVRVSADVLTPHPVINSVDANAVRNAARYGWLNAATSQPWFDIPKWVFSGTSTAGNITGFALSCNNVTRDIYGLCAGDVNGSYIPPSGFKQAEASVDLIAEGTLALAGEMTFPVRAEGDMEIGAITLMLNFDAQYMAITGVEIPGFTGEQPYFLVTGNLLHIGWMSLDPVRVAEGQALLLIHSRLMAPASSLRFLLDPAPISELADGEGTVIQGAKLSMADAVISSETENPAGIRIYPNPARDILYVEFLYEMPGKLLLDLFDLTGKRIMSSEIPPSIEKYRKAALDVSQVANGVYMLKVTSGNVTITMKAVVNR